METRELKSTDRIGGSKPAKGAPLPSGKILEGRYRIDSKLGAGGVGDVYRAEHIRLNRAVAVKVLQPGYAASKKLRLRFEREAHALAMMAHPNIVSINDFGVMGDMPFLVMELLEGEPLSERLKRGALEPATALDVARQVLRALAFAHEQGWVHRDLKPGNIFLQPLTGGTTHVKILDFGLAKMVTEDAGTKGPKLTLTGMVFGTPAYMSPEQAVGGDTDARTDLYSLGVVFFEMLAGRRLFLGSADKMMSQHLREPPPLLGEINPDLPQANKLDILLAKLLAKERGDRPQSAEKVLRELARIQIVSEQGETDEVEGVNATGRTMLAGAGVDVAQSELPTKHDTPEPRGEKGEQIKGRDLLSDEGAKEHNKLSGGPLFGLIGLFVGVLVAAPLMWLVGAASEEGAAPETAVNVNVGPGADVPPSVTGTGAEANILPEKVATAAGTNSGESYTPTGPWDSESLPPVVAQAKNHLATGEELPHGLLLELRRYAMAHRTDDSRPFLLLARNCVRKNALTDGIDRYERAYEADVNARQDPQMLVDLVRMVESRAVGTRASRVVKRIYGREALVVVEQSLRNVELNAGARRRLELLRDELRAM